MAVGTAHERWRRSKVGKESCGAILVAPPPSPPSPPINALDSGCLRIGPLLATTEEQASLREGVD